MEARLALQAEGSLLTNGRMSHISWMGLSSGRRVPYARAMFLGNEMNRCRHCLAKAEPRDGRCPVCGIAGDKAVRELSPVERRVRLHARAIRVLAMAHLVGAAYLLMLLPVFPSPAALAVLAAINAALAFGLASYSFWFYRAATVVYFLAGMVNVVSVNLLEIFLVLVALYVVGNRNAKALFERRGPGEV